MFSSDMEKDWWDRERTSSRIFFQMILVISSPSSSTTGFFTTILSPTTHSSRDKTGDRSANIDSMAVTPPLAGWGHPRPKFNTHDTTACCSQSLGR